MITWHYQNPYRCILCEWIRPSTVTVQVSWCWWIMTVNRALHVPSCTGLTAVNSVMWWAWQQHGSISSQYISCVCVLEVTTLISHGYPGVSNHRWPVDFPKNGTVMRSVFPYHDFMVWSKVYFSYFLQSLEHYGSIKITTYYLNIDYVWIILQIIFPVYICHIIKLVKVFFRYHGPFSLNIVA